MINLLGISVNLFGVPVPSVALFLLAGLLLGHLLWYRDRGGRSAENVDLENRYVKARGSVKQRRNEIKELKKQNETLTEELANLEQNHLTLRSKNKRLEQVSEHSQEELNQFRRSLNESEVQLASEEKRSVTVIGQLQELLATNAELEAENKSHQDGIEQLDQQYRQCVTELESAQCERDTLQSRLRDHKSELDHKQRSLDDLECRGSTQEQSLEESNNSLQETQQDLVARCRDLDVMRSERDTLDQALQQSKQSLAHLKSEMSVATTIQSERDEIAKDLETAANSLGEQRQILELCESELILKKDRVNQLEQLLENASTQIAEEQDNRTQLEQFNTACQSQLQELEEELSKKSDECVQLNLALHLAEETTTQTQQKIPTLSNELAAAREQLKVEAIRLSDLRGQLQETSSLPQQLLEMTDSFKNSSVECQQLRTAIQQEKQVIHDQNAKCQQLSEQLEELSGVKNQLSTAEQTIQEYHERGAALESLFVQQADQISGLSQPAARVPELELKLKREQVDLRKSLSEIEAQQDIITDTEIAYDEAQQELAATITEVHAMETRIEALTADLHNLANDNETLARSQRESNEQIATLKTQIACVHAQQQNLDAAAVELQFVHKERDLLIQTRDSLEVSVTRMSNQITTHLAEAKRMNELFAQTTHEYESLETDFQTEIKARNKAIDELKEQLTIRTQQHDSLADDIAFKTTTIDQHQGELRQLSAELKEAHAGRHEQEQLQTQITELTYHLACARSELEDSLDMNAKAQDRIREIENQLHEHLIKIRELRRERSSPSGIGIVSSPSGIGIVTESPKLTTDSDQKAA